MLLTNYLEITRQFQGELQRQGKHFNSKSARFYNTQMLEVVIKTYT